MKFTILLLLIVVLSSCAHGPLKSRSIASEEENFKRDTYIVGEIKTSLLTPDKFRETYGSAWVLIDGASVEGSEFAKITGMSKLPDARGAFLRMHNNGRNDGLQNPDNTKLGSYQSDELKSHTHKYGGTTMTQRAGGYPVPYGNSGDWETREFGGSETRPKNISVNYYIKINQCSSQEISCL